MTTKARQINYYLSYAFADLVRGVIRNPSYNGFSEDVLPDFFLFRTEDFFSCVRKPQQHTLLHIFIFEINHSGYEYMLRKVGPEDYIVPCTELLDAAQIPIPPWLSEDKVEKEKNKLERLIERACKIVTDGTFQLLFSDRTFLFEFSRLIAQHVAYLRAGEHECVISSGEIERAPYFPVWLKDAVFHRDKGRCQLCGCDLTNIFIPTEQRHIDHMVPLKSHGTNDPTNLQLVCESCNKSKGKKVLARKHLSYPYW